MDKRDGVPWTSVMGCHGQGRIVHTHAGAAEEPCGAGEAGEGGGAGIGGADDLLEEESSEVVQLLILLR